MTYNTSFESTKVIPLGSCAFRQPNAQSHCRFIHGYRLQAKFWFACNKLDQNNWVVDFGGLKELKSILEQMFDHTTILWDKDPELPIFKMLHDKGVIDLRVLADGVGIERFAQFCLDAADKFVRAQTDNRCWCRKVEIWEHENNSAVCIRENFTTTTVSYMPATQTVSAQQVSETPKTPDLPPEPSPQPPPSTKPQTPPLHNTKTYNTFKDPFAGTSWGNNAKR